jgi:hypothetical protein
MSTSHAPRRTDPGAALAHSLKPIVGYCDDTSITAQRLGAKGGRYVRTRQITFAELPSALNGHDNSHASTDR